MVAAADGRRYHGLPRANLAADNKPARFIRRPRPYRRGFSLRGPRSHVGRMPVSGLDIHRSAHQWIQLQIQLHRENATALAREMVETMRKGRPERRRRVAADHRGDRHAGGSRRPAGTQSKATSNPLTRCGLPARVPPEGGGV